MPEAASTVAGTVDGLYYFISGVTAFFTLLIAGLVAFFAIKYRRGAKVDRTNPIAPSMVLESIWIGVPLVIVMVIFFWGAKGFFDIERPPKHVQDIYCVGKQWMWKFQHTNGMRELNEIHVPVGQAFRVTMTSQDVLHDLYIPAFRVKQDVLPGKVTQIWFEATKTGKFHLFCAEYCGTLHSGMIGTVTVMEPDEYQQWLSGGAGNESMASLGEKVFNQQGCITCHTKQGNRCPTLDGLYGKEVRLRDGGTVIADENYILESIRQPTAKVVAGYQSIMPTFQGRVTEEEMLQLVAYIKSLGAAK